MEEVQEATVIERIEDGLAVGNQEEGGYKQDIWYAQNNQGEEG